MAAQTQDNARATQEFDGLPVLGPSWITDSRSDGQHEDDDRDELQSNPHLHE
jgi:hypothetical protein